MPKRSVRERVTSPQLDLFIALSSDLPARDQQDMMERPFFSLSKSKRTIPIEYHVGENYIQVTAPEALGIATIWDADILIWAASQITAALARGLQTSRYIRVVPYDLLRFLHRDTGGSQYVGLKAGLDRLQSTTVVTSIWHGNGKGKTRHRFSWLNEWKELTDVQKRPIAIEFVLPDWLYNGIIDQRLVLSIDPAYFDLTSGIDRWLYRVARKHGGRQKTGWSFTFRQLYEKSGSLDRFANFAVQLRHRIERQSIPEYWLSIHSNEQGEEILHFIRRSLLPPGHVGAVGVELRRRRTQPKLPMA